MSYKVNCVFLKKTLIDLMLKKNCLFKILYKVNCVFLKKALIDSSV